MQDTVFQIANITECINEIWPKTAHITSFLAGNQKYSFDLLEIHSFQSTQTQLRNVQLT